MNEYFLIYLIERLTPLNNMFLCFAFISALLCVISTIVYFTGSPDLFKKYKHLKKPYWLFPVFIFLSCLIPNTNEAYKIIGIGTLVQYANNNTKIKKLPDNLVKYVNIKLEEIIKEKQKDETNNTR